MPVEYSAKTKAAAESLLAQLVLMGFISPNDRVSSSASTPLKEKKDEELDLATYVPAAIDLVKSQLPEVLNAAYYHVMQHSSRYSLGILSLLRFANAYNFQAEAWFGSLPEEKHNKVESVVKSLKEENEKLLRKENSQEPKKTSISASSSAAKVVAENKVVHPINFLERQKLPNAVNENCIAPYLTLADVRQAKIVDKGSSLTLFNQHYQIQHWAFQLLGYVLDDNKDALIAMLKTNPASIHALFVRVPKRWKPFFEIANPYVLMGNPDIIEKSPYWAMWTHSLSMFQEVNLFLLDLPEVRERVQKLLFVYSKELFAAMGILSVTNRTAPQVVYVPTSQSNTLVRFLENNRIKGEEVKVVNAVSRSWTSSTFVIPDFFRCTLYIKEFELARGVGNSRDIAKNNALTLLFLKFGFARDILEVDIGNVPFVPRPNPTLMDINKSITPPPSISK